MSSFCDGAGVGCASRNAFRTDKEKTRRRVGQRVMLARGAGMLRRGFWQAQPRPAGRNPLPYLF
ncbi:hypothetical protein B0G77_3063 [Paraburkholderia sp. BL10I2N1]|nr:hypothetical protein B0G77_3063 [Paraburkholderia sp. BL10I2N1]